MIQKTKPIRDEKYLAWIRTQPCVVCGSWPCQAAHQRLLSGNTGSKPCDFHTLPNCNACHMAEHSKGVVTMWNERAWRKFKDKHELRSFLDYLCKKFKARYDKL